MHGSNYAARQSVDGFKTISSANDLAPGMLVFKYYKKGDSGWTLDKYPRYLPGGKYYNGDLNDYYHVGVVISASPLRIVHMTTPTSQEDDKLGRWSHAGWLKAKYISDAHNEAPKPAQEEKKEETAVTTSAIVSAAQGKTVKMRARPSSSSSLYWDVPVGSIVAVHERGDEWSKISWGKYTGYMKTMFLKDDAANVTLHIPGLTRDEAVSLAGKYAGAWITEGVG